MAASENGLEQRSSSDVFRNSEIHILHPVLTVWGQVDKQFLACYNME
jgi:hypothetical protein